MLSRVCHCLRLVLTAVAGSMLSVSNSWSRVSLVQRSPPPPQHRPPVILKIRHLSTERVGATVCVYECTLEEFISLSSITIKLFFAIQ